MEDRQLGDCYKTLPCLAPGLSSLYIDSCVLCVFRPKICCWRCPAHYHSTKRSTTPLTFLTTRHWEAPQFSQPPSTSPVYTTILLRQITRRNSEGASLRRHFHRQTAGEMWRERLV